MTATTLERPAVTTWKSLLKTHHMDVPRLRGLSEPVVLKLTTNDDTLTALAAYDHSREDDRRGKGRKPTR